MSYSFGHNQSHHNSAVVTDPQSRTSYTIKRRLGGGSFGNVYEVTVGGPSSNTQQRLPTISEEGKSSDEILPTISEEGKSSDESFDSSSVRYRV